MSDDSRLKVVKNKLVKTCRERLKRDFGGSISIDDDLHHIFGELLNGINYKETSVPEVAFVCGVTTQTIYSIKGGTSKSMGMKAIVGLMSGLLDTKFKCQIK